MLEMLGKIAISLGDALISEANCWRTEAISAIQSVYQAAAPWLSHESMNRCRASLQLLESKPKEQLLR